MSEFVPLESLLKDWFNSPFDEIPESLRERARETVFPFRWDDLSPEQRRSVIAQSDFNANPATEALRQHWWGIMEEENEITEQIARWESVEASTASDLALKEKRLAELRQALTDLPLRLEPVIGYQSAVNRPLNKQSYALGSVEQRKAQARKAADARHSKPGGSRDKRAEMRARWASGNFATRDECAEQECAAVELSLSKARDALKNTPDPVNWPGMRPRKSPK